LFFHASILTLTIIYKTLRGNFQAFEGALLYGSEQRITQLEKWLNEYCKFLRKPTYHKDFRSLKNLKKMILEKKETVA
jgi:hypothetical protein